MQDHGPRKGIPSLMSRAVASSARLLCCSLPTLPQLLQNRFSKSETTGQSRQTLLRQKRQAKERPEKDQTTVHGTLQLNHGRHRNGNRRTLQKGATRETAIPRKIRLPAHLNTSEERGERPSRFRLLRYCTQQAQTAQLAKMDSEAKQSSQSQGELGCNRLSPKETANGNERGSSEGTAVTRQAANLSPRDAAGGRDSANRPPTLNGSSVRARTVKATEGGATKQQPSNSAKAEAIPCFLNINQRRAEAESQAPAPKTPKQIGRCGAHPIAAGAKPAQEPLSEMRAIGAAGSCAGPDPVR